MSQTILSNLTVPELKVELGNLGLARTGRKNELVERLQAARKAGENGKRSAEQAAQNEEETSNKTDDTADSEAGPSGQPRQKKLKTGAGNSNVSSPAHGGGMNATAVPAKKKVAKEVNAVAQVASNSSDGSNNALVIPQKKSAKEKKDMPDGTQQTQTKKAVAPAASSNKTAETPQKKTVKVEKEKRDGRIRTLTNPIRERIARALGQRLFLIERKDISTEGSLGQEFTVLGSTGNVYKIKIDKHPSCNCPDHMKGNLCKHILFVFLKVLRMPRDSFIICQRALLQEELVEVFSKNPRGAAPKVCASAAVRAAYSGGSTEDAAEPAKAQRKAVQEEPCSICFDDMSELDESQGKVVWCEDGCGGNFHKQCMQMWIGSKHEASEKTCPLCRTLWSKPAKAGNRSFGEEGYSNLANLQPGMSTERDTSTYSEWGGGWGCYGGYRRY